MNEQDLLSQLSLLSNKRKLAEIEKYRRNELANINQEADLARNSVFRDLKEESKKNNPNYVEHKFTPVDIERFLLSLFNQGWNYPCDIKLTVRQAWDNTAISHHPEWLNNIKHKNNNNHYIQEQVAVLIKSHTNSDFVNFLKKVDTRKVIGSTYNRVFLEIYEQINTVNLQQYLLEELENKDRTIEQHVRDKIELSSKIKMLEQENSDLKFGKTTTNLKEWEIKALMYKEQGYTQAQIAEELGVTRQSLYRLNNKK